MNIKFEYIYRDAANYKQFGQIVLHNRARTEIQELTERLRQYLIDSEFFESQRIDVPKLEVHKFDAELDHGWYEFDCFSNTTEALDRNIDVIDFIKFFK